MIVYAIAEDKMSKLSVYIKKDLDYLIKDGYKLNSPEFDKIKSWNHLMVQAHMSSYYLEILCNFNYDKMNINNSYYHNAIFVAFLTTYGKCFAEAGHGRVKLNHKEVYKGEDELRKLHDRIIDMRNKYAAHNASEDLTYTVIAVADRGEKLDVRHFTNLTIPSSKFPSYRPVIAKMEIFIAEKMIKFIRKKEEELGKTIDIE